ncbi:phage tail sheath subtilisin-like domain-containing protein [Ancylobacter defluvii]|nr:phage tail sheath subtilisin-like domain-containing protein [Ancylobacter defluvii]
MGLTEYPARTLIVAQKLAAGTAVAGTLYPITRPEEGIAYCGAGSVGADMVKAYKAANRTTEVFLTALADAGAGVAATGTLTFVGVPTTGGALALYVEETRIPLALTAGQTVAAMATAAAAAINALTDLPVTALAAAGVVTLTARHKGEVGNGISLAVARTIGDTIPAGTTVTVVAMAGGATNPDVQTVLDAIANEWFTDIVFPWDDATNLGKIAADFAERYKAMGRKDAHAYIGSKGIYSDLVTKGAITNSPFISIIGAKGSPSAPWKWAASLAGVAAFQLANDPARQLRSLVLTGIVAPDSKDCFIDSEQNLLLKKGISTFNRVSGGTVTIDRVVTTYKVSNLNVADTAWMDIMVPKTASRIRYDWSAYFTLTYPRAKLAKDNSLAAEHADAVVTPKRALGSWAARCTLYERRGWIEQSSETVSRSVFECDDSNKNRLNSRLRIIIIGNMMVLAGSLEFEV